MKRLTLSPRSCTEILALLIHMAWSDGQLQGKEKDGIRAATTVFNLTKEQRARLDAALEAPLPLDQILVDALSPRDRSFAYVAAVWLTGVDEEVDPKEQESLEQVASRLSIDAARADELRSLARELLHLHKGKDDWADELATLFKSIPARLEASDAEEVEVAFADE